MPTPLSTPLHLAAAKGYRDIVHALLCGWAQRPDASRGPDLRGLRDSRGAAALMLIVAASRGLHPHPSVPVDNSQPAHYCG